QQLVVVVLALAAADDLPVPLRRQHVVVQHGARVGGVFLHIEGFHAPGVVVDHHGAVVLFGEQRLLVAPDVSPPRDVAAQRLELFDRLGVGNPGKRGADPLEWRRVPLQVGELAAPPLQRARHDVGDKLLLQLHIVVGVVPGDLGLDHPELREVPPRLGLFGAERGPEAVHFAERRRGRLDVQLPRLGEVGGAEVEVLGREQIPRRLADRAGEDGRVDQDEVALVEEVADRLDHLVAHARDGDLAAAAQPQVAMFEQEGGAVLLWRDGEVVARSDDLQVRGGELDAARRARVGPHGARDLDRGLLGELRERLPRGGGYAPPAKLGPPRQETSWPTYLGTPRHDACAAESLNADPRPLWHTDVGRAVRGSPAMGETVLVVGVADRVVALVDRATGQSLWRSRVAGTIHG